MDNADRHEGLGMRFSSMLLPAAAAAVVTVSVLAVNMVAQGPERLPIEVNAGPGSLPAPTNLKVLPKEITGQQVHDLMEQWRAALGVHCDSCHAEDRENTSPDGGVLLKFADDSKPMKRLRG